MIKQYDLNCEVWNDTQGFCVTVSLFLCFNANLFANVGKGTFPVMTDCHERVIAPNIAARWFKPMPLHNFFSCDTAFQWDQAFMYFWVVWIHYEERGGGNNKVNSQRSSTLSRLLWTNLDQIPCCMYMSWTLWPFWFTCMTHAQHYSLNKSLTLSPFLWMFDTTLPP